MSLEDAFVWAAEMHRGQHRKGPSRIPYIVHPAHVVGLLYEFGVEDEALMIAGALHDVVEDTPGTIEEVESRFGERVASIVKALTKPDMESADAKVVAMKLLEQGPAEARIVKMADRLSNIISAARTGWSDEKIRSYCREGRRIVDLGEASHKELAERLSAEIECLEAGTR